MATKAWVYKSNQPPKFKCRIVRRCQICGRKHAVYRKFKDVGQFVDEENARPADEGGFEIELSQLGVAVLDEARGKDLQAAQKGLGLAPAVGFDDADEHVDALGFARLGGLEHGIGLADAGGGAEEDLQLAAAEASFLLLRLLEQFVGVGALRFHRITSFSRPAPG